MTAASGIEPLRVFYVGDLMWWGTCVQRLRALEAVGCNVVGLGIYESVNMVKQGSLSARVMRKIGVPLDFAEVNKKIVNAMRQEVFDVLWLDKGLLIKPETLRAVRAQQPACKIVGYTPDDMSGNPNNQSKYFLQHLPFYDVFFTTKSFGVAELRALGCPHVVFVENGFDPQTHRSVELTAKEKVRLGGALGFIGAWEKERMNSMIGLARAGLKVRVWGSGWRRAVGRHANLIVENQELTGEAYASGICSFDINLGFLRKVNRDLQTQRSVEIPACGAFMLAERTDEQLALFEEGKEAEFFSSDEELLRKARYYLEHPVERNKIAAAGRHRCLSGGYSNHERMKFMLREIARLSINENEANHADP